MPDGDQAVKVRHSTLFAETIMKLGLVHGPRQLTAQGSRQLVEQYAQLERTFQELPEFSMPEEGPGGGPRVVRAGGSLPPHGAN